MLKSAVGFRAASHDDAGFAAAVLTATDVNHPAVASEVLDKWINTEQGCAVRRFIVEEDGLERCWISLVQPRDIGGGVTYLNLVIRPSITT